MVKITGLEERVKEYRFPSWVWFIFGIVVALMIFMSGIFVTGIIVAILFALKSTFTRWALEIGRSPVAPFFWVLGFGFIGLLIYWIYYTIKLKGLQTSIRRKLGEELK